VRIPLDAASARAVRGRTWHSTQVIHALPGGAVEMTLRTRDEGEIARWVLSWGGRAWVIDPPRLRNRVREIAREILARHEQRAAILCRPAAVSLSNRAIHSVQINRYQNLRSHRSHESH